RAELEPAAQRRGQRARGEQATDARGDVAKVDARDGAEDSGVAADPVLTRKLGADPGASEREREREASGAAGDGPEFAAGPGAEPQRRASGEASGRRGRGRSAVGQRGELGERLWLGLGLGRQLGL